MPIRKTAHRSLWSYNPLPTGCVLYLPLWHPSLRTAYKSVDLYGHTATPTGTTQQPKGKLFDRGASNKINMGDHDVFSFTDGAGADLPFSVAAWINLTDATASTIMAKNNTAGDLREWVFNTAGDDSLSLNLYKFDDSSTLIVGAYLTVTARQGTYFLAGATYSGSEVNTGIKVFANGADETTNRYATGTYAGMTKKTDPLYVGADVGGGQNFMSGSIGDVWMWDYELTTAEMLYLYQRTRGRYD